MSHNSSDLLNRMAEEAARELDAILHPSARAKAKNMARSLIGRGNAGISDPIFWPAGLLLTGLMQAGRTEEVEAYLAQWQQQDSPVRNPDDALTGTVLLSLHEQTGKETYRSAADKIHTYLKGCLRDENGSIIYGQQSGNSWIYADGTGMTSMFLSRYAARMHEDRTAQDITADARLQLLNFLQYGMDARSGLPYHGYDAENRLKLGIIGWGRAVGWLLLGMSEYLIRNPEDAVIAQSAGRVCAAVMERIREDGMLSWQLDCLEGPLDTSATGMIFYSLLRMERFRAAHPGMNLEHFPDIDSRLIDAAASALYEYVEEDGKVYWSSAECVDFAQYRQQYGHYPWGQGSVLAFLALYENT